MQNDGSCKCLIYGDSLTYAYLPNEAHEDRRLPEEERYTSVLEKTFSEVRFSVFSKVGRTIPYLPFEWADFKEACAGMKEEDFLIFFLGVNDYLSFGRPDSSRVVAHLREFFQDFHKEGILFQNSHILYICPPTLDFRGDRSYEAFTTLDGRLNAALTAACTDMGISSFDAGSLPLPHFPDGVHITGNAQRCLGEKLSAYLKEIAFFRCI